MNTNTFPDQRKARRPVRTMRIMAARWLAAALLAPLLAGASVVSAEEKPAAIEFAKIQDECVQTDAVKFGPGQKWSACKLTRAGFISTIGLLDFYYAEYCLVKSGKACDRQALMVFANRAYRKEATLQLHRVDAAGSRYDAPITIGLGEQNVLTTAYYAPKSDKAQRAYFNWSSPGWKPVDTVSWRKDLWRQLPEGMTARLRANELPDPATMTLQLPLLHQGKSDHMSAPAGNVAVQFAIEGDRLLVADVKLDAAHH
jgi:hypothetical protein